MKYLMLFLFICGFVTLQAEDSIKVAEGKFSAHIKIIRLDLHLDELLEVQIALSYPEAFKPNLTALRQQMLDYGGMGGGPFFLDHETIGPPQSHVNGITTLHLKFFLSPQFIGQHYLLFPRFDFQSTRQSEPNRSISGGAFEITVTASQNDFYPSLLISPLLPLKQELPIRLNFSNHLRLNNPTLNAQEAQSTLSAIKNKAIPWPVLLSILAVGLAIILIRIFPPTVSAKKSTSDEIDPETAAMRAMQTLTEQKYIEKGHAEPFIAKLDHIIRKYIENSYHIKAPSLTTPEFLQTASTNNMLDTVTSQKLKNFLEKTDRVKFARHHPTPEECQEALTTAEDLVKNKML